MARMKDMYKAEVAPALMKKFEYNTIRVNTDWGFDDIDGEHHTLKSIHCKVRQLWVYILRIPI